VSDGPARRLGQLLCGWLQLLGSRHLRRRGSKRGRQSFDLVVLTLLGQTDHIQVSGWPVDQSQEEQATAADNQDAVRGATLLEDGSECTKCLL